MILFELSCSNAHQFEAWFKNGATYDTQSAVGNVACPICGDNRIVKAPMAPHVARSPARDGGRGTGADDVAKKVGTTLEKLRNIVEQTCKYVGGEFPEQARRIHYGEVAAHGIYGEASDQEAVNLREEGIEVVRVPWPLRRDD